MTINQTTSDDLVRWDAIISYTNKSYIHLKNVDIITYNNSEKVFVHNDLKYTLNTSKFGFESLVITNNITNNECCQEFTQNIDSENTFLFDAIFYIKLIVSSHNTDVNDIRVLKYMDELRSLGDFGYYLRLNESLI